MKVSELAKKHQIDEEALLKYIQETPPYSSACCETYWGIDVPDNLVDQLLNDYAEEEQPWKQEKRQALANMLITSGFNFDGYRITKYSGYISGDDAISVDRGLTVFGVGGTDVKDKLLENLVFIRRNALQELKEAAYALGCNAVIGVDFDYLTLDPQTASLSGKTVYMPYVFGVTANGNAVVIERDETK